MPAPPEIPEAMTTGELLDWWQAYVEKYRVALQESEADKAAIKSWIQDHKKK